MARWRMEKWSQTHGKHALFLINEQRTSVSGIKSINPEGKETGIYWNLLSQEDLKSTDLSKLPKYIVWQVSNKETLYKALEESQLHYTNQNLEMSII